VLWSGNVPDTTRAEPAVPASIVNIDLAKGCVEIILDERSGERVTVRNPRQLFSGGRTFGIRGVDGDGWWCGEAQGRGGGSGGRPGKHSGSARLQGNRWAASSSMPFVWNPSSSHARRVPRVLPPQGACATRSGVYLPPLLTACAKNDG
jgi:hypothetical protein